MEVEAAPYDHVQAMWRILGIEAKARTRRAEIEHGRQEAQERMRRLAGH